MKAAKKAPPKADTTLINAYITSEASENAKGADVRQFFRQLFREQFRYESDAEGADGYVPGQLVIELKTKHDDWLAGFYQALHYAKKGLGFAHVVVLSHRFIGLWRMSKLPETARIFAHQTPPLLAPSDAGRENARKTTKGLAKQILESAQDHGFLFDRLKDPGDDLAKGYTMASFAFLNALRYLDHERVQINQNNFLEAIEEMQSFFARPLDAVHAFYDIVRVWDPTAVVSRNPDQPDALPVTVTGKGGEWRSEPISPLPNQLDEFARFVKRRYVFTNEGSGLTTDYYFSRFDEVMARIDPEYVKQHGIFFTAHDLSKFALWFVDHYFDAGLTDNYVVLDPAGGSGNLVSAWRRHVRHKIVSELQPDLLRIIDRRLRADPWEVESGFTIVPKVSQHTGLNFLDRPAADYYERIRQALHGQQLALDKPFAFLLNPPYKNTDERESARTATDSAYAIDSDILSMTGNNAGKERYLAFLGQIHRLAEVQTAEHPDYRPVLLIFTPTSWLIPLPTIVPFRKAFDQHWQYEEGFIVASNEFFKLEGRWPLAFTVWRWRSEPQPDATNDVRVRDLTHLTQRSFTGSNINWAEDEDVITPQLRKFVDAAPVVSLNGDRPRIRLSLPIIGHSETGDPLRQTRVNLYRQRTRAEQGQEFISGFPLTDERHRVLSVPYGYQDGPFVGFMDNLTPIRVRQDALERMSNEPDRVWFYLDDRIQKLNLLQAFSGPADNRSFCAYDIASACATFGWFGIGKALAVKGNSPLWMNLLSLWPPNLGSHPETATYFYQLCFAYGLAENRCVETTFEADNPVAGAPEVRVQNPLAPLNKDAFWYQVLAPQFAGTNADENPAAGLVRAVEAVYRHWMMRYTATGPLTPAGLEAEPYFKYFHYPSYLTRHAGLVQIRKYAELHAADCAELIGLLEDMRRRATAVRGELHRVLVEELHYFAA